MPYNDALTILTMGNVMLEENRFLFEIAELDLKVKTLMDKIELEQKRKASIRAKLTQAQQLSEKISNDTTQLNNDISILEKDLFGLDAKIAQNTNAYNSIKNNTELIRNENEKQVLQEQKDLLEQKILEFLEELESCETKLSDNKTYMEGLNLSIKEIDSDVETIISTFQKEIDKTKRQIELLIDDNDTPNKNVFLKVREKFLYNNPISKLNNSHCGFCKMNVAAQDVNTIKNGQLITCSSCKRLIGHYI